MISDKLKALREKKGLSQTEVADILNIQQGSYSNYERGRRTPDLETLKKIANFYNVSSDYLIDNDIKTESEITKLERELTKDQKKTLRELCKLIFPIEFKKIEDSN